MLAIQRCCNHWLFDFTAAFLPNMSNRTISVSKASSPKQLPLTKYFPFSGLFSVNSEDSCNLAQIPVVSPTTLQSHRHLHCSIMMAKKTQMCKHLCTLYHDLKRQLYWHVMLNKSVSKWHQNDPTQTKICMVNL